MIEILVLAGACSSADPATETTAPTDGQRSISEFVTPSTATTGFCPGRHLAPSWILRIERSGSAIEWETEIPAVGGGRSGGWPLVSAGMAVVGSTEEANGGYLLAVDAASGEPSWQVPAPSPGQVVVAGSTVVMGERAGSGQDPVRRLVGLDVASGERAWDLEVETTPALTAARGEEVLAVSGDSIAAYTEDGV